VTFKALLRSGLSFQSCIPASCAGQLSNLYWLNDGSALLSKLSTNATYSNFKKIFVPLQQPLFASLVWSCGYYETILACIIRLQTFWHVIRYADALMRWIHWIDPVFDCTQQLNSMKFDLHYWMFFAFKRAISIFLIFLTDTFCRGGGGGLTVYYSDKNSGPIYYVISKNAYTLGSVFALLSTISLLPVYNTTGFLLSLWPQCNSLRLT